jgi:hypothetical protein
MKIFNSQFPPKGPCYKVVYVPLPSSLWRVSEAIREQYAIVECRESFAFPDDGFNFLGCLISIPIHLLSTNCVYVPLFPFGDSIH